MTLAIVTHSTSIYRTTRLTTELEKLGVPHRVLLPKYMAFGYRDGRPVLLYKHKKVEPTLVLNALFHSSGKGLDMIEALEATGMRVVNSAAAWRRAKSKPLTTAYLTQGGIPHPDTWFSYRGRSLSRALRRTRGRFVLKPWFGSLGKGIRRGKRKSIRRRLRRKPYRARQTYLQKYISNPGRDIRVVVVDGKAIGATYRVAPPGQWKTNVTAGGRPVYCRVNRDLALISQKATRALDLEIAGVDVIEGPDGYVILELNAWPEYEVFDSVARVNVAGTIALALARKWQAENEKGSLFTS